MGLSDFLVPFIAEFSLRPFRRGPGCQPEQHEDLAVLAQEGSVRARGLGPRRADTHLALAVRIVLPSASLDGVGALTY